jgi:hypothetical protein
MNRIPVRIGRLQLVVTALKAIARAANSSREGKQEWDSAARRTFVAGLKTRFRPQHLAGPIVQHGLPTKAVETQAGKNPRAGSAGVVADGDD